MDMLGRGSGDTLPLIFKHLSSPKEKVRLERVCKLFQKQAKSAEAWSDETYLEIYNDLEIYSDSEKLALCRINDDLISDDFRPGG